MLRAMVSGVYGSNFDHNGKKAYEDHNTLVRRLIPMENLLEYSPGDGWSPLCRFLDCDVPDEDFPHVNDSKAYQDRWNAIVQAAIWRVGLHLARTASLFGIGAAAGWYLWYLRV
jgi:hypothetical protein